MAIYGKDKKELFENAAFAMFDQIAELKGVKAKETFKVLQEAANAEELLVAWLREILYQFSARDYLFKEFLVEELGETRIRGLARGERIDRARHKLKKEIKAVTYHELEVKKLDGEWRCQVVFDT